MIGKFVGDQYMSNTDTEASRLDDYFVTDLNFSYSLPMNSIFKKIIFSGMINNIFDLEYVDRGYTYLDTWSGPVSQEIQGYYPQATRNFLLGASFIF